MTTLKELHLKTHENLLILQEREAKYSGNAPLELLNQIRDHQEAIDLIKQALSSELTETSPGELKEALRPLLVASNVEMVDLDTLKPEIPPLPFEPETALIPAGPFVIGSQPGKAVPKNETPQHEVNLRAYRIGLYPVMNEQYAEFVKQTKHPAPKKTGWFGKTPPKNKLKHPVVGVSWDDALAYCQWLSEQTGRAYRLPTEAEWEKAARGDNGQIYPWGNAWAPGCCNCANSETTAVTTFSTGQSPYGCLDMLGNVWEWTSTLWGPDWQESDFPYPYQPNDGREDLTAGPTVHRVFRGGSFADEVSQLRCSARRWYAPDHADKACGFRVVLEVEA